MSKQDDLDVAVRHQKYSKADFDDSKLKLEEELKKPEPDKLQLEVLLQVFESERNLLDSANEVVQKRMIDCKRPDDEFKREHDASRDQRRQFTFLAMKVSKLLLSSNDDNMSGSSGSEQYRMKLPKRELPKYDGDVRGWLAFWASFEEIDKNVGIPDTEKYHYLIQSTVPESAARKVVMSYPVSGKNYKLAVESLKDRFGRNKMLVKVYVRDLLQLVIQNASGSHADFMDLVTDLSSQIRNLGELGVTSDKCADILYPVVESALPDEVLEAWQRNGDYAEDLDKLIEFLKSEVNNRTDRVLAQTQFKPNDDIAVTKNKKSTKPDIPTATAFVNHATENDLTTTNKCGFCDGDHPTPDCRKAISMSLEQRTEQISSKGLCYKCLRGKHSARNCKKTVKCILCSSSRHYTIMCPSSVNKSGNSTCEDSTPQLDKEVQSTSSAMANHVKRSEVPLQTLMVKAYGANGKTKIIRAMLDTGSQKSYVVESVIEELELKKIGEEEESHQLFGGSCTIPRMHTIVKIFLSGLDGSGSCNFDVSSISKIADCIDNLHDGSWMKEFKERGITFSDQHSGSSSIDILVGNDIVPRLYTGNNHFLPNGPVALETTLGWVLAGKLPCEAKRYSNGSLLVTNCHVKDKPLADLWALDLIGITDTLERKSRHEIEKEVEKHFYETVTRTEDGRYEVKLPWVSETKSRLPKNYEMSLQRLHSTTRKLKNEGYFHAYDKIFALWLHEKIIEEVPTEEEAMDCHYVPHRAVIKLKSETTPVRPVFDCSAKLKNMLSLNECLDKGPNYLEFIPAILLRFMMHPCGVVSDIKGAFLEVGLAPEERNFLRFLWWKTPDCNDVKIYRHTRAVFGVGCSPFLLAITLKYHLSKYPVTKNLQNIMKSFYVDNCVVSVPSLSDGLSFRQETEKILLEGKFLLRGWEMGPCDDEKIVPVLGLLWNTKYDTLSNDITAVLEHLEGEITQRKILSIAHMLYDPLGWLCPYVLNAKILLRECHKNKLGWDNPLPMELKRNFEKWISSVGFISSIKIPRYFGAEEGILSLIMCCDASKHAYAASIFMRVEMIDSVRVQLLQAKARVAPLKHITIPRLELLSMLIGARLLDTTVAHLNLENVPKFLFTDSTTALTWIQRDIPYGTFVTNRVDEIRKLTNVDDWNHIPGSNNPADLPSRGCNGKQLLDGKWWEGPSWLYMPMALWPRSTEEPDEELINAEKRKTVVISLSITGHDFINELVKLSDYHKILRRIGFLVRYMNNLRNPARTSSSTSQKAINITLEEVEAAERVVIKYLQKEFVGVHDKRLEKLHAFIDKDGILKMTTRLLPDNNEEFATPIILPNKHEIVKLLIAKEHQLNSHAGVQYLQSLLRQRFWIIHSRRTIRNVVHNCAVCRRHLIKRLEVPVAPLPRSRTAHCPVFSVTGVDLAGPLFLRGGKKIWIVLFTCAVYRAVHLEVTDTLSTDGYVKTLRRFIARRGRPRIIYSDNGSNFRGCDNLFKTVDWNKVRQQATVSRIDFRFSAPTAAWWGGWWERLIGLVKQLIRRNLGNRTVNYEDFITLLCEVESVVNSRSMTYISEDGCDPAPLTPMMFLRDNFSTVVLPEADVLEAQNLHQKIRQVQRLRAALRTRFTKEYLAQLVHYSKK